MEQPRIALVVEHPLRDIPGAVLTAYELCSRGAICYIVPLRRGEPEIWALAPDLVLLPAFRPQHLDRVRRYMSGGISYGLLDTEQIDVDENILTMWKDRELLQNARCVFAWGQPYKDRMVKEGYFTEKQVVTTGCPRFDLYSEELASVYRDRIVPKNCPEQMILINTNFAMATSAHSMENYVEWFGTNYQVEKSVTEDWYRTQVAGSIQVKKAAHQLAADFPDIDVVIRPHFEEQPEKYVENGASPRNLKVIREGPVYSWILRARVLIQRCCTTALEATMAGVPALAPSFVPFAPHYPLPESVSLICQNYESLRAAVCAALKRGKEPESELERKRETVVRNVFHNRDGKAHMRVADAVMERVRPLARPSHKTCRRYLYVDRYGYEGNLGERVSRKLRHRLSLSPQWSFKKMRAVQDPEFFDLGEVKELIDAIGAVKDASGVQSVKAEWARNGAYIAPRFHGRSIVLHRN